MTPHEQALAWAEHAKAFGTNPHHLGTTDRQRAVIDTLAALADDDLIVRGTHAELAGASTRRLQADTVRLILRTLRRDGLIEKLKPSEPYQGTIHQLVTANIAGGNPEENNHDEHL